MSLGGTPTRRQRATLNDSVDVCLTRAGKAVLARFYEKGGMNTANLLHAAKGGDMYTFRLQELMNIFGEHCIPGGPELFKGGVLFIDLEA